MNAWRQSAAAALRAWAARRHGRDELPLRVERRRIYILPTGRGLALAALIGAMTLAGLNYASNLGLMLSFLLAGIGLVGMHHCHRNLLGLRVDGSTEADAFAGGAAGFRFTLYNDSGLERRDIEIRTGAHAVCADVPAGAARCLVLPFTTASRGVLRYEHFELRSRFPFGWFRAWTYVQTPLIAYVAPRPLGDRRPAADTDAPAASNIGAEDAHGEEEFAGLRPYTPGTPLKHMAWKALAHGGEPAVRYYTGRPQGTLWFDWNELGGLAVEARLSQLCAWVLQSERHGRRYGLRLPGGLLEPAIGAAQLSRALRMLAAFGGRAR